MTEAEWLACRKPDAVLQAVFDAHRADPFWMCERQLRLFACACYRRVAAALPHVWNATAVEIAERFADGLTSDEELHAAARSARLSAFAARRQYENQAPAGNRRTRDARTAALRDAERCAFDAVERATQRYLSGSPDLGRDAADAIGGAAAALALQSVVSGWEVNDVVFDTVAAEKAAQADLVRCIFGNPFRATHFASEWLTDTTRALARQMYELRDFSGMPILADALQDAGCENEDVLQHCRNSGPHARGCWVVDAVLGKA